MAFFTVIPHLLARITWSIDGFWLFAACETSALTFALSAMAVEQILSFMTLEASYANQDTVY